jgi:D-amino-acid dehydrogenase
LALESKKLLEALRQDIDDDFSCVKSSKIVLYEDAESLAKEVSFLPKKLKNGSDNVYLSLSEAVDLEPAIENFKLDIKGAIFSEQDEVGDSLVFCQKLFNWLQDNNTKFVFNRRVEKLATWKNRVTGYFSEGQLYETEQIISCLGPFTSQIIDHPTPVLPVKGYSFTLNPGKKQFSKSITLADKRILFTRLGNKIRITGFADFVGLSDFKEQERLDLLLSLSKKIAPDLADFNSGELTSWSGFRPLTPSNYPIIGPTSKTGLHINSGQGFYGWTLACASGKRLAEFF